MDATAESADADQLHSVISFDAYTEPYTVTGPYPVAPHGHHRSREDQG